MAVLYEPCVIGADGRCTRWSHDHEDLLAKWIDCPACGGSGKDLKGKECRVCRGSGKIEE